jgi:phospholipase D1/2
VRSNILHLSPDDLMGDCTVVHDSEDIGFKDVLKGLHTGGHEKQPQDATLEEEMTNYTRGCNGVPSSAETLTPTIEKRAVAEFQPPTERAHMVSTEENTGIDAREKVGGALSDANVKNSTTADASMVSETYSKPSGPQIGKSDGDSEEQRVPRPRKSSRKNLNIKSSQSPWAVLTPKPKYHADSFEDPICDEFWEDIWLACASHNVGLCVDDPKPKTHHWLTNFLYRPRSSVACSVLCRTTSLPLGSITRTLSLIKSVC